MTDSLTQGLDQSMERVEPNNFLTKRDSTCCGSQPGRMTLKWKENSAAWANSIQRIVGNTHRKRAAINLALLYKLELSAGYCYTMQYYCIRRYISAAFGNVGYSSIPRSKATTVETAFCFGASVQYCREGDIRKNVKPNFSYSMSARDVRQNYFSARLRMKLD